MLTPIITCGYQEEPSESQLRLAVIVLSKTKMSDHHEGKIIYSKSNGVCVVLSWMTLKTNNTYSSKCQDRYDVWGITSKQKR